MPRRKRKLPHPNRIWAAIGAVRANVGNTEDRRIVEEASTRQDRIGEAARKILPQYNPRKEEEL